MTKDFKLLYQPLVTVIVAVLNSSATLQRCIDSVVNQSYPHMELILIDGGSTDGSVDIIKHNSKKIAFWQSEPDRGIYHAWNKALNHARGEWISFVGADDFFASANSIKAMLYSAHSSEINFISAKGVLVDKSGRKIRVFGKAWEWKSEKRRYWICHPGSLYHRSLFERFGRFSEHYRIVGDSEFNLRAGSSIKALFIDKVTICVGEGGLSRNNAFRTIIETIEMQSNHKEIGKITAEVNGIARLFEYLIYRLLKIAGLENKIRTLLVKIGLLNR